MYCSQSQVGNSPIATLQKLRRKKKEALSHLTCCCYYLYFPVGVTTKDRHQEGGVKATGTAYPS
jgi:hypothetical protein